MTDTHMFLFFKLTGSMLFTIQKLWENNSIQNNKWKTVYQAF